MSGIKSIHSWHIADLDRARDKALADSLGIPPIVAHLLRLRGVGSQEDAKGFLAPTLGQLSDPFSLTGMRAAVQRIGEARERQEHVHIFGDYDVDGITSTAVLLRGLRRFGLERVSHATPNRLTEGYGITPEHVRAAHSQGVSLIITVDNGISAHAACASAKELGIDVIVTDHHAIDEGLPEALAVINPKQESPESWHYHLCGAGVAFKLAAALNGVPNDLDIVALGTVADIVPLLRENRVIVSLGLRHMIKHQRTGLAGLAKVAGFELGKVSSERIGFQLGPRLNAAGRMDDPAAALELILADCPKEALRLAKSLDEANRERRNTEDAIFQEALEEIEACFSRDHRTIVVAREGWHPGVIGIVASRLENRFRRPVFVVSVDESGTGRGSGRSSNGFDLVGALSICQHHLVQFGGHRSAAGMTIDMTRFDAFRSDFEAAALGQMGRGEVVPTLEIDALASFSEIDSELLRVLDRLEPHGHENPAPLFCSMGVEVVPHSARIIKDKHLKLSLRQNGKVFPAIGWSLAEQFYTENLSGLVDVAYTPQFTTFRGETYIQLVLRDLRGSE